MDMRCQDPSALKEWKAIWQKLVTMDEQELYKETGCMAKCQRKELAMNKVFDGEVAKTNDSIILVAMFYPNGRYREGRQYYTYDINTFLSDFGGYLGLLLGYSIASILEMTQEFFTNFVKQLVNRVKISSG